MLRKAVHQLANSSIIFLVFLTIVRLDSNDAPFAPQSGFGLLDIPGTLRYGIYQKKKILIETPTGRPSIDFLAASIFTVSKQMATENFFFFFKN